MNLNYIGKMFIREGSLIERGGLTRTITVY